MGQRWLWGPKLRELFDLHGLPWSVVDGELSREQLGSSPGDCYYDGQQVILERTCPVAWVAHELAHYIVCKELAPGLLHTKNYGYEWGERRSLDHEAKAADVTIAILIHLRYPWRRAAFDMSMAYNEWPESLIAGWVARHGYGLDYPYTDPRGWRAVARAAVKDAAPFMEWAR